MRLLSVHPLDAPVVVLAVDVVGAGDDAQLRSVAAVKAHGGQISDSFSATVNQLVPALPVFVGGAPIVGYGLSATAGLLAQSNVALGDGWWDVSDLASLVLAG